MLHKISLIITTFQRVNLLKWGLYSLSRQDIPWEYETLVINDGVEDESEEVCKQYQSKLHLKYIFSGQRNLEGHPVWRVPGFAINIGVRRASGDILILSCAEMLHLNDTVARLGVLVLDNPKSLGIPLGKDDRDGAFLNEIERTHGVFDLNTLNRCADLDTRMPFLMALQRAQFEAIGGYDEDFTGVAYDDRDFVDRLLRNGCVHQKTDALALHLYHPRADGYYDQGGPKAWDYNKNLFFSRMGSIVRNQGREWGRLDPGQ
ncbi:Glycosyl transferase family 2 [Acididesulfobacillus acetoxydans]|uniref:Glycosyl transferase n=1 Tax=Acididesulfobacillus acetoxydans TaxID=1561005 RepID=A0A8S0X3S9_9FIRM|nr:glycosyltransferase [Acididesulfobacillus acetoxydans]CAA7600340.1 Glycosyl transferase family 2 [Acididesulfobacillus acetoxydans]CEJ07862.1 Glycosyl transferase [Acididesulfobacillus acetoxydans]